MKKTKGLVLMEKSNLSITILKGNIKKLYTDLRKDKNTYHEKIEILKNISYYENILYDKIDFDEYMRFQINEIDSIE
jgi:hypothetical protein